MEWTVRYTRCNGTMGQHGGAVSGVLVEGGSMIGGIRRCEIAGNGYRWEDRRIVVPFLCFSFSLCLFITSVVLSLFCFCSCSSNSWRF